MVIMYINAKAEPVIMSVGYGEITLPKINAIIKEIGIKNPIIILSQLTIKGAFDWDISLAIK